LIGQAKILLIDKWPKNAA